MFIKVTYNGNYFGGDYSYTGDEPYVLIPVAEDVEKEFTKRTGLAAVHILYYSEDELYDSEGNEVDAEISQYITKGTS